MNLKTISLKTFLLLIAVILCVLNPTLAQTQKKSKKQKQETPNERFYRLGGKETKAEVIWQDYELTTSDIIEKRNLALYDAGGHFNCRQWVNAEMAKAVNCDASKIRDFIWQHWQNKQRGYIRVTLDSVDAVTTSHIFIEPTENDEWHIRWRLMRHSGVIHDRPEIHKVEQEKPEKRNEKDASFVLVFKYAGGEATRW